MFKAVPVASSSQFTGRVGIAGSPLSMDKGPRSQISLVRVKRGSQQKGTAQAPARVAVDRKGRCLL